jgi:hypothetical protein
VISLTNPNRRYILPSQEADLRRLYFSEYKKLIKAGEHPAFAATMADLTRLKERNRILSGGFLMEPEKIGG